MEGRGVIVLARWASEADFPAEQNHFMVLGEPISIPRY